MAKIMPAARAWYRKFSKIEKIDATFTGPRIAIPVTIADEPQETRRGSLPDDRSPFYEMSPKKLWGYYFGYASSYERRRELLYADLLAFRTPGLEPIVERSVDVDSVRIKLLPVPYRTPPRLKAHADRAVEFFKKIGKINRHTETGEWENNRSVRINSIGEGGIFTCQPVRYFDQVGTNLTVDWASGQLSDGAATIRSGIERPQNGLLPSLGESSLANSVGTATMFYDWSLKRTFVRVRSDNLASIAQRALHCTVSGVLEMPPESKPGEHGIDFFLFGTRYEIKMETNLDPDKYLLFPIALARELPRAGKPQLFFVAVSLVDDATFERECQNAKEKNEYILPLGEGFFDRASSAGMSPTEAYTYEGWACEQLALDFVEANEAALKERVAAQLQRPPE